MNRTIRRQLLDTFLDSCRPRMRGCVIDLGGKKLGKRGLFRPPTEGIDYWHYVNLSMNSCPDILADIGQLPIKDEVYDIAICTETLEHAISPGQCVLEIHRILKPGGLAIVTIPFLFPVHSDPNDYHRFTSDGLSRLFSSFSEINVGRMGGYSETVMLMLQLGRRRFERQKLRSLSAHCFLFLAAVAVKIACCIERTQDWSGWTTGYFVVARR